MLPEPSTLDLVLGTTTAVGTVAAVVAAVVFGPLREWRRRPKLTLHFDRQGHADTVVVGIDMEWKLNHSTIRTNSAYARLRVRNAPGKAAADDVEVIVADIREVKALSSGTPSRWPTNVADQTLAWSSTDPPAAEEAGAPWAGFHTFRHTCASILFERGANAVQVQRWLGHHSAAFTLATYVHLLSDDLGEPLSLGTELERPSSALAAVP